MIDYHTVFSYSELIYYLSQCHFNLKQHVVYSCQNPLKGFNLLKSYFKFSIAAGGMVKNQDDKVLMIYKNGFWDLPKGKLNLKESTKTAALREVFEETNASGLKIASDHFSTYHVYFDLNFQQFIFKETKWFLMISNLDFELIPQLEEGISKVSWVSHKNIHKIKTYESVKLVLKKFMTC